MDNAALAQMFKPLLTANRVDVAQFTGDYIAVAMGTVKSSINFLNDLRNNAYFYFKALTEFDSTWGLENMKEESPPFAGAGV